MVVSSAGCASPGKVVAQETSVACPECRTETKTTPLKGLTYEKHVCGKCKTTVEERFGDGDPSEEVHVCGHCKWIVGKCKLCKKQAE